MITRRALLRGALAVGAAAALDACTATPSRPPLRSAPSLGPTVPPPAWSAAPAPAHSPFVAPPVAQRRAAHPVARENARPGTPGWWAGADGIPAAEGYL